MDTDSIEELIRTSEFKPTFSFNFDSMSQVRTDENSPISSTSYRTLKSNAPSTGSWSSYPSKAVAYAMRALQDRIRDLEISHERIQGELLKKDEERLKSECDWKGRFSKLSQQKHEQLQETKNELEALKLKVGKDAESGCAAAELKSHIELLREELAMKTRELGNAKHELQKQAAMHKAEMEVNAGEIKRYKEELSKAVTAISSLTEELQHSQGLVHSLRLELSCARSPSSAGDSYTLASPDAQLTLRLQELCEQQSSQKQALDRLEQDKVRQRKVIERLNGQVKEMKLKILEFESEKENVKRTHDTLSKVNSCSYKATAEQKTFRNYLKPEAWFKPTLYGLNPSNPISSSDLELGLAELNRQYKALLEKASEDDADLEALKAELNAIATSMEAKSRELLTQRRKEHKGS
mmetsp:Transcript_10660/g.20667  ORF Transcript_10660/g.20667 Transcript_10660/m.20667 type:complete len:410 (-) Transcript_10660:412-1641(-)|eukprot:CAMPEP_0204902908 /NCGR_PEP_ID=MMETSP1397-20131031/3949_1 /ASSEMBLY_ACC=CAM_ASM_000891 /TAXON_ID=49980 /ORGANISM="Climacostomum Climacostomum virens, Strain Stock W-24" /LENGTH=409 /DNA_ID=CAMNT_0052071485 /DNA_START=144 /DNA_END=1373 /DNA_ORIENTATION=-